MQSKHLFLGLTILLLAVNVFAFEVSVPIKNNDAVRYIAPDNPVLDSNRFIVVSDQPDSNKYYAVEDLKKEKQVNWLQLTNFPTACPAGYAVSKIGLIPTCVKLPTATTSLDWNALTNFPSGCSAGEYVRAVGSSLTCVALPAGTVDTNCGVYGSCPAILYQVDANNLFAFKTDVNTWGDLRYYPLVLNPAGYLTSASLSGYVPYQAGTADLNLGSHTIMVNGVASGGFPLYTGGNKLTPSGIEGTQLTIHGNSFLGQNGGGLETSSILYGAWSLDGDALYFIADNTSDIGTASNTAKNIYTRKLCDATKCYTVSDLNFVSSITDTNCAVTHSCANVLYVGDVNSFSGNYSDLNGKPYIPTENDIDFNSLAVINSLDLNNSLNYLKTSLDTNWQTSWTVFDANMRSYFQLIGNYLTVAQGDVNYWAKTNNFITVAQSDSNLTNYTKITDFNSYLLPQTCPVGQALNSLSDEPVCVNVGQTPWTSDINANGYDLNSIGDIILDGQYSKITNSNATANYIYFDKKVNISPNGYSPIKALTTPSNFLVQMSDTTSTFNDNVNFDSNLGTNRVSLFLSNSGDATNDVSANAIWQNNFITMATHGTRYIYDYLLNDGETDAYDALLYAQGGYIDSFNIGTYHSFIELTFFQGNTKKQTFTALGDLNTLTKTYVSYGSVPSVSSCGTNPSVVGNDTRGVITTGTGAGLTSCTLTFASAWANAPVCVVTHSNTATRYFITSVSTTTLVIGFSASSVSNNVYFICIG